jgi:hypothetical protein
LVKDDADGGRRLTEFGEATEATEAAAIDIEGLMVPEEMTETAEVTIEGTATALTVEFVVPSAGVRMNGGPMRRVRATAAAMGDRI